MIWSQGAIDFNEYPDNSECVTVCDDPEFDSYVIDAVHDMGPTVYSVTAYSWTTLYLFGARNCQSWVNDVLRRAREQYLENETCPKCFR